MNFARDTRRRRRRELCKNCCEQEDYVRLVFAQINNMVVQTNK